MAALRNRVSTRSAGFPRKALLAASVAIALVPFTALADAPAVVAVWSGASGALPSNFSHPEDAAVGPDGLVYVVDQVYERVVALAPSGDFVRQYGSILADTLHAPSKIAFAADGTLYVADGAACGISMWKDGGYLGWFGGCGSGPGKWIYSFGVAVHGDRVYVSDTYGSRIEVFDLSGQYLLEWPTHDHCEGLDVDAQGNVYVAEYRGRVDVFDPTGTLLRSFGEYGHGAGQLDTPYDLALDGEGDVLVADSYNNRIQVFTTAGTYVGGWGSYGDAPGQFHSPWGVSVGPDGRVYVADTWNNRVQVFESLATPAARRSWGSLKSVYR